MNNQINEIKSYKIVYPQIYSYILPNRSENTGSQKIGYTERKNVQDRIKEQVRTAVIRLTHKTLWNAPAFFNKGGDFKDTDFHKFLIKSGVQNRKYLGKEWFFFNGHPNKSKELFNLFRKEGFSGLQNNAVKIPYILRSEQEEAVQKAKEYFESNEEGEFLWNAKPRFGKTLASYDLAKRLNAKKVLIVTNRPAIANSWFDDYKQFIEGYEFISTASSLKDRATLTREQYIASEDMKPQISFLSLQDIKGSEYFGGYYDKLKWVTELNWDLLIIDESHEGIDTHRTDKVLDSIKRKHTLYLSGTPFKALAHNKFPKEAIFNWTYLDEQKMKQIEIEEGEVGDHTDLPDLKLFTYRISQMITNKVNEGVEIDNETHDFAFDLNEFFSTKDRKFVYEEEVKNFLKNLRTNEKYPFSTPELREELKHTFWYVGNRVDSVKALEQILKEDPVFKDYEVVVAAGDGRSFEEEENDFKNNERSYNKVKKAIADHDKTITLSCGQLTTGVTVKEWSAVLMLTDIKSPSLYMQAAFRAQNPFKKSIGDGKLLIKKSSYLFDFAPTRVLEIYDKFANGLNLKSANDEVTEVERKNNIKELLNFFPVISEDVNGQMVELDAEKVLMFPNALAAAEIVNARFMTNLLFNDSLKGVFNFPGEVEEILDKMFIEKNKRVERTKNTLNLDDARKAEQLKNKKINENTEIILGEKIFKSNIEKIVDDLISDDEELISPEELSKKAPEIIEPLIAKYKEIYKTTNAENNETIKQIQEKIKVVAEEYNSSDNKDKSKLKENLNNIFEEDLIKNKVIQKEEQKVGKVQKTKEEEVRDRLRSFTRTIPMFIMANSSKEKITIDNFDEEINDQVFQDLTNITKEEFHKLRDGFGYEEDGEIKRFEGVFNKYRFNASIAEFQARKNQLSNYFTSEEDIFELIPSQKNNQIFTPKRVVQMMINKLEEYDPSLFTKTDSTFIDLYMKSGMYITEIVKKLFVNTRKYYNSDKKCLKHILEHQVYGLAPTQILHDITQSYIFGFDIEKEISRNNFVQHDITPEAKDGNAKEKLEKLFNLDKNMKFTAVVGNPPYQIDDGGAGASATPIYHKFVEQAKKMQPKYLSLITPARWYSGGKGLDQFRKEILNDDRLRVLHDFPNARDIFPNVEIKGGVCFFLWDRDNHGLCKVVTHERSKVVSEMERPLLEDGLDIFVRHNKAILILRKVLDKKEKSFSDIVSPRKPFGLTTNFSDFKYKRFNGAIKIYANKKIGYLKKEQILRNEGWVSKYKILIPKAIGIGNIKEDLLKPILIDKDTACTETYIVIGPFDKKIESENVYYYIKTKFFHFLLGLIKNTQDATAKVYKFVPIQDFSESWSDEKLYKKYNLTQKEIDFIESMVRGME